MPSGYFRVTMGNTKPEQAPSKFGDQAETLLRTDWYLVSLVYQTPAAKASYFMEV